MSLPKKDLENSKSGHCKSCPVWKDSVFAHLSDEGLDRLALEKSTINYERSDVFSEKGKPAQEIYCLRSGSAKVTLYNENGETQSIVRLVAPGDMLGYRCIFSAEKFRGTASALVSSSACKISKGMIFELIRNEKDFSLELLKRMGEEVAAAEYHHHSFCQKRVRERMAEALLILKNKFGVETSEGWKIDTYLTRTELSNWVGATKETIIRCLTDFKEEGLIQQVDDRIYLRSLDELRSLAGL